MNKEYKTVNNCHSSDLLSWNSLSLPPKCKQNRVPIIALEGHNGVGKTTMAKLIANHFQTPYNICIPDDYLSEKLKLHMLTKSHWQTAALYFLAGVCEKIKQLQSNKLYNFHIMDRSLWSTLSAHASEEPSRLPKLVNILNEMNFELFEHDYTIILDDTFQSCCKKIQSKKNDFEKELDNLVVYNDYYKNEYKFYTWLTGQRRNTIFKVSVSGRDSEQVFSEDILPLINKILEEQNENNTCN